MLKRIEADELKALIDKMTEKEVEAEETPKATNEFTFFVVQRSDGLFWGGVNYGWCILAKDSLGFREETSAYQFVTEFFRDNETYLRLRVLYYGNAAIVEGKGF